MENQNQQTNSSNTKNDLQQVSKLLYINPVSYYGLKTIRIIFEITSYATGLLIFIGALFIPSEPFKSVEKVNESVTVMYTIHINEVTQVMVLLKIVFILLSIAVFCFGLLLGSIRRKNNKIKSASELISKIQLSI